MPEREPLPRPLLPLPLDFDQPWSRDSVANPAQLKAVSAYRISSKAPVHRKQSSHRSGGIPEQRWTHRHDDEQLGRALAPSHLRVRYVEVAVIHEVRGPGSEVPVSRELQITDDTFVPHLRVAPKSRNATERGRTPRARKNSSATEKRPNVSH